MGNVVFKGFAQGFQTNKANTSTDCFIEVGEVMFRVNGLIASFNTENFEVNDWLRPVYKLQETMMEGVRMMSACQVTNFSKQLSTRTTSWGGVMDLGFNIIGNIAKYYAYTTDGVYTDPLMYTDPI